MNTTDTTPGELEEIKNVMSVFSKIFHATVLPKQRALATGSDTESTSSCSGSDEVPVNIQQNSARDSNR